MTLFTFVDVCAFLIGAIALYVLLQRLINQGERIMSILDPIRNALVDLKREVGESNAKITDLATKITNSVDPAEVNALAQEILVESASLDDKNKDDVPPAPEPAPEPPVAG